jgi:uncharacterized protein
MIDRYGSLTVDWAAIRPVGEDRWVNEVYLGDALLNSMIPFLPDRVSVSDAARQLIDALKAEYGAIMFHQSGGCCDGSAPMCFRVGEFKLGSVDEKVGEIAGCEYWMDRDQFRRWAHTQWTVDVVPGRGASFSLEAPLNLRFLIRSSLCTAPGDTTQA